MGSRSIDALNVSCLGSFLMSITGAQMGADDVDRAICCVRVNVKATDDTYLFLDITVSAGGRGECKGVYTAHDGRCIVSLTITAPCLRESVFKNYRTVFS